ncbi:MAG: prolyl oligopeptidase family serine peptidase [Vicinamibacterales bacterium]
MRRVDSTLLVLLVVCLAVPAVAQTRRAPTLDDMLDLVQVSSPQISPDGSRVLFTKSELKAWRDNRRVSSVWIANADGSDAFQFLGSERDTGPQWSPDGKLIAFLSTRDQAAGGGGGAAAGGAGASAASDAGAQIWLIRSNGGEAWKLTDHNSAVRRFEWAEDCTRIFFSADDPRTEEERTAERQGDDVIYVDEGPNGQGRGRWSNLWSVTVADRKEQQITKEKFIVGDFAVSPDAKSIAFTYRRQNERNGQHGTELAVVDVATGAVRDLTKNDAPESGVAWSPDGSLVSFTAPGETTWELSEGAFYVVPAAGGTPRRVGPAGRGRGRYYWAPDGRSIVYSTTRNARGGIFRMDIQTGAEGTIVAGDWAGGLDSVTKDLKRGAAVISSPSAPGDVNVVNLESGAMTAVTRANPQVSDLSLAQFRAITWKSRDGLQIEGLLWLPAEYKPGTRLPLLLSVHGGPAGVWSTSFRPINHVYAGLGWAILEPNVRGSSSYGDALLRGNMKDIGGGDYWDAMTGVDAVIAQGIADPNQMAVRGWSYGGIMTGWIVTQTDRFKAASAGAMVSDWASEYAMGFNHDVRRWYIGGTPWENPEGYRRQSSYTHIARVKTPTIVIHGEEDTTDTIGQSMMFYQGLKDRGVPVRFLRFPREPHGFRQPHHQRIRDAEEISWLMKHARGLDWTAPPRKDKPEEKKT